ncbi:YKU80 [Malassezia furfur]|nr:YKU80 [Malassezia furfur]
MAASLGQRTLVTFVLDVSSAMGSTHGERSRLDRSTAFVSLRVLEMVSIVTYGSERTNNIVRRNGITEGYEGVDEVWPPSRPTLATLDVLNALRPARRETRCDHTLLNTADVDTIKARLAQDAIQLRVMGFDFPADPMHSGKTEVPHSVAWFNVGFWRTMLQDLPHAAFASADDAEEQALLPNTQLAKSAPTSVQLTFGAPDGGAQRTLSIPVQVLKATAVQRPMSQRKVRKGLETPVDARRVYYKVDDVLHHEDDLDQLQPLPEESHASFQRAFKLGASLVPMQHAMEQPLETQPGLEILHFVHASTYRREYHLGETSYVVANPKSPRANIALSSLVQAALVKDVYLLCRWVSRAHADPKLCVLAPLVEQDVDCFCMVRVPFREDVKRFAFPPLDRVPTKDGTEVRTHPTIPTDAQQADMDRLVDAMDLMDADPDGDPEGWYAPNLSFNPAIHGVKNAVKWRFLAPERADLPELHSVLAQFLSTPEEVERRARSVRDACAAAFAVRKPQASAAAGDAGGAQTTPSKKARADSDSDATPDEDADDDAGEDKPRNEVPVRGGGVLRLAHVVQDFEASVYGTEHVTETCEAMQAALLALVRAPSPDSALVVRALHAYRSAAAEIPGTLQETSLGLSPLTMD